MNVLVSFMRSRPDFVDHISGGDLVSLPGLAEGLEDAGFPYAFGPRILAELTRDEQYGALLSQGYLRVLPAGRWHAQLESQGDPPPPSWSGVNEWATFVHGRTVRGVSLPQDNDLVNHRLSVFAYDSGRVRRVSVKYPQGLGLPSGLSASPGGGGTCSFPDWGECSSGCDGVCTLTRVYDDDDGLACLCVPTAVPVEAGTDAVVESARGAAAA